MSRPLHQRPDRHRGFTLVELLMAIAIIGVLVALTVAGVNAARTAILKRAIALEVATLAQAVEAYKQKYGEYPPDGSSRAAFEAHFSSVFPNIAASELALLVAPITTSHSPAGVMDPAEALVFCLGGFSNDPQYPFTGNGGPIVLTNNGVLVKSNMYINNQTIVQYNTDRNEGFFPFGQDRLTLDNSSGVTVSNDELLFGTLNAAGNPISQDVLPAYLPRSRTAPIVYFSAATYSFSNGGSIFFNFYGGSNVGVTRPYKSDQVNTAVTHSAATGDRFYRYMNEKSFQIISAGLDDDFGGTMQFWPAPSNTPMFFRFPSGRPLNIVLAPAANEGLGVNYQASTAGPSPQLDNVTNFSEGPLESSLP